jgi:hypothetical protein
MWKFEKRFVIFRMENGLMLHPMDDGYYLFNQYGYDTEEEAFEEIKRKSKGCKDFFIVPTISSFFDVGEE